MKKVDEIRETIQNAFEEKENIGCDLLGLYNYIRYGNEDFGNDMIINDVKPPCDNTLVQHYYLALFISQAINLKYEVPEVLMSLYVKNRSKYNEDEIKEYVSEI